MINRKNIALIIFIVSGCTVEQTPAHVYTVNQDNTFIAVCSDTATIEEIETYASEYGESTGLIWQSDSQCVTFDK